MTENLVALKLMLDALGESPAIDTLDDRKRVQKGIYLGQAAGVNLGYRYGWYLLGPYSPPLARDYYQLGEQLRAQPHAFQDKKLRNASKLKELVPLFSPPNDLDKEDWLELLASYHYLRIVSRQDDARALVTIQNQKPRLAPHVDQAKRSLTKYGLL